MRHKILYNFSNVETLKCKKKFLLHFYIFEFFRSSKNCADSAQLFCGRTATVLLLFEYVRCGMQPLCTFCLRCAVSVAESFDLHHAAGLCHVFLQIVFVPCAIFCKQIFCFDCSLFWNFSVFGLNYWWYFLESAMMSESESEANGSEGAKASERRVLEPDKATVPFVSRSCSNVHRSGSNLHEASKFLRLNTFDKLFFLLFLHRCWRIFLIVAFWFTFSSANGGETMIEIPRRKNQKGRGLGISLGGQNGRIITGFVRRNTVGETAGLQYGDEIRKVCDIFLLVLSV